LNVPGVHTTVFWDMENVNIFAGSGNDTINVAKSTGELSRTNLAIFAGNGADTLNIYDHSNPNAATYTVASAGSGSGSVDAGTPAFGADFHSISTVNLHVKKSSGVNTSAYNAAHYVLNILSGQTPGEDPPEPEPKNPVINPSPAPPAPPADDHEPVMPASCSRALLHHPVHGPRMTPASVELLVLGRDVLMDGVGIERGVDVAEDGDHVRVGVSDAT
jgi:hypothetical protein